LQGVKTVTPHVKPDGGTCNADAGSAISPMPAKPPIKVAVETKAAILDLVMGLPSKVALFVARVSGNMPPPLRTYGFSS
jgi:hypothetical protein